MVRVERINETTAAIRQFAEALKNSIDLEAKKAAIRGLSLRLGSGSAAREIAMVYGLKSSEYFC